MDSDADSILREVFAAYAPPIQEEPFLSQARAALAREEQRARRHSRVRLAVLLVITLCAAALTLRPLGALSSGIESGLATWNRVLSPLVWQLLIYGLTAAVAFLGRRRIRTFLAPW